MAISKPDLRSGRRKVQDEQIAAEPQLPPPDLAPGEGPRSVEEHLRPLRRRPVALLGVVENGFVRLLDPQVKLPEQSRVIIVASGPM